MQFREMIRSGDARDCADLARLGGLTRERISQIMKLLWLLRVFDNVPLSG